MPLISVIIPAYNGVARYLDQAITSVMAQTFSDFELIVVDDASSDETAALIARFPTVQYVRRMQNGGQAAARNEGAHSAKGQYVAFLDQDDLWETDLLKETLAILQRTTAAAVVHCDGFQVSARNDILEYDAAMKHRNSITQLLRGGHDVATSGSLFRKTSFDAVGGYDSDLPVWEDIDLAIRLYQRFSIVHLAKPLYRHRLYGHNASRDIPSERALLGRQRFLDKCGPLCKPGTREARALSHDWAHYYGDLGKHYLCLRHAPEARRAFRRALYYQPLNRKVMLRLFRSFFVRNVPLRSTPSPHEQ